MALARLAYRDPLWSDDPNAPAEGPATGPVAAPYHDPVWSDNPANPAEGTSTPAPRDSRVLIFALVVVAVLIVSEEN